jgi:DNA-binding LytR/AlgR family response regulator
MPYFLTVHRGHTIFTVMMTHFYVRQSWGYERIEMADIRYLEASKKYCKIWLAGRHFFVKTSLKQMEIKLPGSAFIRVHRAYIISLRYLKSFNYSKAWVDGKELPIGERGFSVLRQAVTILKQEKYVHESTLCSPEG